jgi:hypothetical protein
LSNLLRNCYEKRRNKELRARTAATTTAGREGNRQTKRIRVAGLNNGTLLARNRMSPPIMD